MRELRFYRCAFGPNFEIFQWDAADGQRPQPRNSDIGGHHLAFYVDDLDARRRLPARARRPRAGRADREPQRERRAALGVLPVPWGMQLELVSYPGGKAYESLGGPRLWHPARPSA